MLILFFYDFIIMAIYIITINVINQMNDEERSMMNEKKKYNCIYEVKNE